MTPSCDRCGTTDGDPGGAWWQRVPGAGEPELLCRLRAVREATGAAEMRAEVFREVADTMLRQADSWDELDPEFGDRLRQAARRVQARARTLDVAAAEGHALAGGEI